MKDEKEIKGNSKLNYGKLNQVLKVSHKVLKILYFLAIIACIFTVIIVAKELKILAFILSVLKVLSPLFIGLVIAWLFDPVVTFLNKKGIKRIFSVIIIYILLLSAIGLIVGNIIPILYDQIISFASTIPSLFHSIESTLDSVLDRLKGVDGIDVDSVKQTITKQLENASSDLTDGISTSVISFFKGLVSGVTNFVVGLVIGFFFLLSFDNIGDTLIAYVPKKSRKDVEKLVNSINGSLRNYVVGVIIDATVVFGICSLAFGLIGLRAPLLFALFCAITNVIPYVGPYIGAVPALIVGFSISPTVGFFTLIAIVIIQFFEGNFLQETIMSKTTKLHPVTIIMGLLIFGHYWGIIGMVISTPLIAVIKQVYLFFDEKYDFFKTDDDDDEEDDKKQDLKQLEVVENG